MKSLLVPLGTHIAVEVDICSRGHRLLLAPTLQMVTPSMFPVTLHLKVKVSPGQVDGGAVNCPVAIPTRNRITDSYTLYILQGIHAPVQ